MCPPKFTKQLADLTINDGESLTLTCHVQGDPDPSIVWTKNNKVFLRGNGFLNGLSVTFWLQLQTLSSSEVIDLKYKNGIATLRINEVYPEDEGEYICKATNSVGSEETRCRLTIKRMYNNFATLQGQANFIITRKLQNNNHKRISFTTDENSNNCAFDSSKHD